MILWYATNCFYFTARYHDEYAVGANFPGRKRFYTVLILETFFLALDSSSGLRTIQKKAFLFLKMKWYSLTVFFMTQDYSCFQEMNDSSNSDSEAVNGKK